MLVGLVGKSNTGKSTFFSAATMIPVEIGSYPFTTIKPNHGIGYIRSPCVCREFNIEDQPVNSVCLNGVRLIPVELIDCAGLVPNAWQGRGLGNQFLDDIRRADALIHVVDAAGATDSEGITCKLGSHDPTEDVNFIDFEMTMWLAQILQRNWAKLARTAESGLNSLLVLLEERLSGIAIKRAHILKALRETGLNDDKPTLWSEGDFLKFVSTLRKIAKPMLIAANKIDLKPAEENIERLKKLGYSVVPCSAEAELVLRRAASKMLIDYKPGDSSFTFKKLNRSTESQKKALQAVEKIMQKFGSTGVQDVVNHAFYKLLDMIVVYPVEDIEHLSDRKGRVLPDAYLVPNGTTARQLAYMIHTELGDGFIFAVEAREKKRVGEKYVLNDRDVISIISTKKHG